MTLVDELQNAVEARGCKTQVTIILIVPNKLAVSIANVLAMINNLVTLVFAAMSF